MSLVLRRAMRQKRLAERKSQRLAQEEMQPGDVSPALRRRMRDDDIVAVFEEAGRNLYNEVVESLKDVLRDQFERSIPELDRILKEEGGRRWQKAAADFYRPWINDMVETIVTQGMNEAAGALEDVASSYAAEQSAPEAEEGDELIEVPVEETEEVEPDEDAATEEGGQEGEEVTEEGGQEGEDISELEELLAADTLPRTSTRPKPRRRRIQADDNWRPPLREQRLPTPDPSVEEAVPPFVEEVLNAILDGLEDRFAEQVEARRVGVFEETGDPWGLLTADTWNVDVLYDDRSSEFDIVAAVHGPQESFEEQWLYSGDVPTNEMGANVAQWLNSNLAKVHRMAAAYRQVEGRDNRRPFDLEEYDARPLALDAKRLLETRGAHTEELEGVYGEYFQIPFSRHKDEQASLALGEKVLFSMGASPMAGHPRFYNLPGTAYVNLEWDPQWMLAKMNFYEEDVYCIIEPC